MSWIDAHHHLWDLTWRDQPWTLLEGRDRIHHSMLPDEFRATIEATPVRSSVVVQVLNRTDETIDLLDLVTDVQGVVGMVGWVDLTDDVDAQLAVLRAHPMGHLLAGIRHMALAEPNAGSWHLRPDVQRGLTALAAADLAYDLIIRPEHLTDSVMAFESLPTLKAVLNHCAKPLIATGEIAEWAAGLRRFAALPNTYCKLSGLVSVADRLDWRPEQLRPYALTVLELFGPARVMFGSDWPGCTVPASYERVVELVTDWIADLSPADQQRITAGTATEVYGLPRR